MKLQVFNWPSFALVLIGFWMTNVESVAVGKSAHFHRQQKRSVLSLPRSVFKVTGQIIVPVLSLLNQTNTYLWFDFPSNWPIPNNNNLNTLYNSFGRLKEKGIEVDEEFVDEQRANKDRRSLYLYIEGFFQK